MPLKNLFIAVGLALALVAGVITFVFVSKPQGASGPQTAMLFPDSRELPEFELFDHDGNVVGREVFRGHWNLVFFGFTNCPDICPMTLTVLSQAKRELKAQGKALPRIVLVSVDPERDTPEKLSQYIAYFGDGNLGLTGSLSETRKLTSAMGIFFDKTGIDGDDYTIDHSAVVMLVDPDGRQFGLFSSPHVAGNFVNDLPLIMARK